MTSNDPLPNFKCDEKHTIELITFLIWLALDLQFLIHMMADKLSSDSSLKVLLHCHKELIVFVRNNLDSIALFLRQKDIIDHIKFNEVSDIKSMLSPDDKAKRVVIAFHQKVEENDRYFQDFKQHLIEYYSDSPITAKLESAINVQLSKGTSIHVLFILNNITSKDSSI